MQGIKKRCKFVKTNKMTSETKTYLKYILRAEFDNVEWQAEHIYEAGLKIIKVSYDLGFTSLTMEMLEDAKFEGFNYSIDI